MGCALITGASKGIGKAIARELAAKGYDLLLVARSENLLKDIASTFAQQYKVQVHYLTIDLAQPAAPTAVYDWCRQNNYTVSVLVNNAGYGLSGKFEDYSLQEYRDMMQVNMNALVELSYLFLPRLKQQPKAYIMNISSSAAYQAVPYLSLYAATKSFVLQFSRGLRHELRSTSVSVTSISPGATDTDFVNRAKIGAKGLKAAGKFNMTAEAVAKIAVDSMFEGKAEVITGFINKLGAFFVWLLPKNLTEKTAASLYE